MSSLRCKDQNQEFARTRNQIIYYIKNYLKLLLLYEQKFKKSIEKWSKIMLFSRKKKKLKKGTKKAKKNKIKICLQINNR